MNEQMKKEINSLVENVKNVYVSSVDENGYPNTKACIYYCDEPAYHGLMLIGTIEVCTDDDYCVYKFTAEKGRYYPGSSETFDIKELL